MGDEGLPVGGSLAYLLQRDGIAHWLKQRRRLKDVYLGRDYTDVVDTTLSGMRDIRRLAGDPVEGTAKRLAAGEIGAIYTGRMEYGPRALGARSILANPSRRETHDLLNTRLDRTEFMPFAPVIAADKAADQPGATAFRPWCMLTARLGRRRSCANPIHCILTFSLPSSAPPASPSWSIPASTSTRNRS